MAWVAYTQSMKRDIYRNLVAWKKNPRKKPLVLRGARQVGKTTLLKNFGRNEFDQIVYLNFEEDPQLKMFFAKKLDPMTILPNLRLYLNQKIDPGSTLLIFDEIQECPEALNSLKYFQEQAPEYSIAAAGSLLGVKLARAKGFPVGKVHFMDLYPLSFFEFLTSMGRENLREYLELFDVNNQIPEPIHEELLELLKQYFFIGGMPEAVANFIENKNFDQVRIIQKDILTAYSLDFVKHASPSDVMKITRIWESIPSQLAKENKKFIFAAIAETARGREYEEAIQWLTDAGLIYRSHLVSTPKIPLTSYQDPHAFKIFLIDIGLLGAMVKISPSIIIAGHALFTEFKGAFTENYVAQTLMAKEPHEVNYWASTGTAEIDFICHYDNALYPLEVKAGNSRKHKSLSVYDKKYQPSALTRTNLLNFSISKENHFFNYPLYLVSRFPELVSGNI